MRSRYLRHLLRCDPLRAQLRASRDAHKPRYLAYFLKPLGVRDYRVEDGRNLSAR